MLPGVARAGLRRGQAPAVVFGCQGALGGLTPPVGWVGRCCGWCRRGIGSRVRGGRRARRSIRRCGPCCDGGCRSAAGSSRSVRPPLRHQMMWCNLQREYRTEQPGIAQVEYSARSARRWARFANRVVRPRFSSPGACRITPLRTITACTSVVSLWHISASTRSGSSTGMPQSIVGPPAPLGWSASATMITSRRPGRTDPRHRRRPPSPIGGTPTLAGVAA